MKIIKFMNMLFLCLLSIGISACMTGSSSINPPVYPNAQNLTTKNVSERGLDPGEDVYQLLSFDTTDQIDDIKNFYYSKLNASGWETSSQQLTPNNLRFIQFSDEHDSMYTITISITNVGIRLRKVEIKLGVRGGE
jgi:hypothetical protein